MTSTHYGIGYNTAGGTQGICDSTTFSNTLGSAVKQPTSRATSFQGMSKFLHSNVPQIIVFNLLY